MNYYGFPPGYNPHHPRSVAPVDDTANDSRHIRARLDGGEMISRDGEWIYHFRFGDYWRAHWTGEGYGAWEKSPEIPDGAVRL